MPFPIGGPLIVTKPLSLTVSEIFNVKCNFISFHLFADNIAIYKADTVILGCRSPQGNNLLRGAYRKQESRAAARKPRDAASVLFC